MYHKDKNLSYIMLTVVLQLCVSVYVYMDKIYGTDTNTGSYFLLYTSRMMHYHKIYCSMCVNVSFMLPNRAHIRYNNIYNNFLLKIIF